MEVLYPIYFGPKDYVKLEIIRSFILSLYVKEAESKTLLFMNL